MTTSDLTAFPKNQPLVFACVLVSLACGVILYLHADNLVASQEEYTRKSAEAAKMTTNVRNSANLPEQVAEIQKQRAELESRLMKASQIAINLQYFYKLEAETEVKFTDIRQGGIPRTSKDTYSGVPFSITVQGSFAQLVNFVTRLQNGRHFCRVNTAIFSKAGRDSGGSDMMLVLTVDLLGLP